MPDSEATISAFCGRLTGYEIQLDEDGALGPDPDLVAAAETGALTSVRPPASVAEAWAGVVEYYQRLGQLADDVTAGSDQSDAGVGDLSTVFDEIEVLQQQVQGDALTLIGWSDRNCH